MKRNASKQKKQQKKDEKKRKEKKTEKHEKSKIFKKKQMNIFLKNDICCEWTFHSLRDWAHVGVVLCELPTASSYFGSTGVQWVLTGTHPCGPPSRMMEVTRSPALCGLWSWCCCQVVLWSHREVCEYECISTPLHWLPRLHDLGDSLRSLCK